MPDPLLTLSEVAEHLGVPLQTIYTWRHHGEMPIGIRVGRHIRVRRPDLDAWVDARADPPPAATTVLPDLGANHEGASEYNVLSAGPMSEGIANYWTDRREHFMQWLPCASRPELEARALREFDRAESAAFCIGNERRCAELLAQRMASYAVCEAEDWTAASKRPSYTELTRRRAVVD